MTERTSGDSCGNFYVGVATISMIYVNLVFLGLGISCKCRLCTWHDYDSDRLIIMSSLKSSNSRYSLFWQIFKILLVINAGCTKMNFSIEQKHRHSFNFQRLSSQFSGTHIHISLNTTKLVVPTTNSDSFLPAHKKSKVLTQAPTYLWWWWERGE